LGSGLASASPASPPSPPARPAHPRLLALTLALVIGCDLWLNAQHFWVYAPNPQADVFRPTR